MGRLLLEHDTAGEGPPVVLLHAGVADRRMWAPQWEALAERFGLVRCDLRGFGDTPIPAEPFSHAQDVIALVEELGAVRAAFVGSSLGGRVALEVATLRPDLVSRLALLCSGLRNWEWSEETKAVGAAEDEALERGDLEAATQLNVRTWLSPEASDEVRELVHGMQHQALEVQHTAYTSEPTPGPETPVALDLETIDVPTLVVCGLRDLPDFVQIAHLLAREIPHAMLVELDSAHLPNLELPGVTTDLLLQFLA